MPLPKLPLLLLVACSALALAPAALAQDPSLPPNYQPFLVTPSLLVYHVHYAAHEHVATHPHPATPTLFVYLDTSGPIRFTHPGNPPFTTERPPSQPGAFRLAPAMAETHAVDNLGPISSESVRVEFPQLPHNTISEVVRGSAPADLTHDLDRVEYQNPAFSIERIVCQPGETCSLSNPQAASLYIAITPAVLLIEGASSTTLSAGHVQAILHGKPQSIRATASTPAHLLRVRFTAPAP